MYATGLGRFSLVPGLADAVTCQAIMSNGGGGKAGGGVAVQPNPRVRPHVARAVAQTRHVVLDFDGVMFDVLGVLGPSSRADAVAGLLASRPYRPRPIPISFCWFGVHRTLEYLAEREPDHAAEAETLLSGLELDAALTARRAAGLAEFLTACATAGRRVAVVSALSHHAVVAGLRSHALDRLVGAVAGRQGLDMPTWYFDHNIDRVAAGLSVAVSDCLVVSGSYPVLSAARGVGAARMGCECGRDQRKHLAEADVPVISGLATLTRALQLL